MTVRASSPTDLLVLGRGIVRWRPIVSGVLGERRDMGEVSNLTISTTDEKLEKKSHRSAATPTIFELTRQRTVEITITGEEFDEDVMAALLMGEKETVAATAGDTGEIENFGILGAGHRGLLKTGNPLISNVVVEDLTATSTLVEGVDYRIVDPDRGYIELLTGSLWLPATSEIQVTYDWAAQAAGQRIKGGTLTKVEGQLEFAADNANGPNRDLLAYRVSFTPDGELGLITDEDTASWTLKGKILDDAVGDFGGSSGSPLYELTDKPAP